MGKVSTGLSMSLDGFIAGPNDGPERPLGALRRAALWVVLGRRRRIRVAGHRDGVSGSRRRAPSSFGRRTERDGGVRDGTEDVRRGGGELAGPPRPSGRRSSSSPTTREDPGPDGAERPSPSRHRRDRERTGASQGSRGQLLEAGLLDEVRTHLAPGLLGDGVRLFERIDPRDIEVENTRAIGSPRVTHLAHRVGREG